MNAIDSLLLVHHVYAYRNLQPYFPSSTIILIEVGPYLYNYLADIDSNLPGREACRLHAPKGDPVSANHSSECRVKPAPGGVISKVGGNEKRGGLNHALI